MFDPKQMVFIANKRICPFCNRDVWEWIKDNNQFINGRCSVCQCLYVQRNVNGYIDEEWKDEGVDLTPYI